MIVLFQCPSFNQGSACLIQLYFVSRSQADSHSHNLQAEFKKKKKKSSITDRISRTLLSQMEHAVVYTVTSYSLFYIPQPHTLDSVKAGSPVYSQHLKGSKNKDEQKFFVFTEKRCMYQVVLAIKC